MKQKILIVDDLFDDLETMKNILKKNFQVITATNGARALDALIDTKFDLIIIDIKMPILSGYDLTKLLREKLSTKSKLMYVTIVPQQDVDMTGVDGFIQKPFSPKTLLAEVKKVLQR